MTDSRASTLNVSPNRHDATYRVPGLLSWSLILGALVWAIAQPDGYLIFVRVLALLFLLKLLLMFVFYVVGLARCRQAGRRWERVSAPVPEDVHHVVFIPNFREPPAVLARTLEALAAQENASNQVTVVLATEGAEAGAAAKARALRTQFAGRFARVLITIHPENLPGEVAGKGANQAWAAREARTELVDRLGMPLAQLTLTSCDADSLLPPHYLAELARQFSSDPRRNRSFWQAPIFFSLQMWRVPAIIRLLQYFASTGQLADLASPLIRPLPYSTYSLSYKLADEIGYWDPAVIAEDWHMYLRCFFATGGDLRLQRVFLPVHGEATGGESMREALRNFYLQQMRHAWGAEDISYILQQWRRPRGPGVHQKMHRLAQVLAAHLLRSTVWFIFVFGTLATWLTPAGPVATFLDGPFFSLLLRWGGLLASVTMAANWILLRLVTSAHPQRWRLPTVLSEALSLALMPVAALMVITLPGLEAQTKLMLGRQLRYRRTPRLSVS